MRHNAPAHTPVPEREACLLHCAGLTGRTTPQAIHACVLKSPASSCLTLLIKGSQTNFGPKSGALLTLGFARQLSFQKALYPESGIAELHAETQACCPCFQGAVRAVSRIVPRAHQPRRDAGAHGLPVPLYEDAHQTVPPFQIQSCSPNGSSSDWAIVQLEQDGEAFEPQLYRCVCSCLKRGRKALQLFMEVFWLKWS